MMPLLPISLELVVEITYPMREAMPSGLLVCLLRMLQPLTDSDLSACCALRLFRSDGKQALVWAAAYWPNHCRCKARYTFDAPTGVAMGGRLTPLRLLESSSLWP